jgi:hypothetical protein
MEECGSRHVRQCKATLSPKPPSLSPLKHDGDSCARSRCAVFPTQSDGETNERRHGELLFAFYSDKQVNGGPVETAKQANGATLSGDVRMGTPSEAVETSAVQAPVRRPVRLHETGPVKQDPVDDLLDEQDGKIPRKRGPLCKHGPKGMCMPLEVPTPRCLASLNVLAIRRKVPRRTQDKTSLLPLLPPQTPFPEKQRNGLLLPPPPLRRRLPRRRPLSLRDPPPLARSNLLKVPTQRHHARLAALSDGRPPRVCGPEYRR